ncbi:MAG: filamentous hemagglutinin family N-terminal domain, partial [Phormidium sp. OSCR]
MTPDLDSATTLIEGGAMRGSNLFHSFQEFNVNSAEAVYFHNPVNIENILTRVTGDNLSNIDGVLGVNGAANLFFLNPNGIVFGPNATLDVNGSFFASTANSLVFRDGSRFSATAPESPPLLTVGVPVGVQFGNSPGAIEATEAVLAVPEQATLALLGGAIALDGAQLEAPGGQVALGGVSETGTITLSSHQSGPIWQLSGWEFPDNLGRSPISLTNNAYITVVDSIGGEMAIDGSDITISNSLVQAGIAEGLGVPDTDSGNIELNATGQLTLSNSSIINRVAENSVGNAGDIRVVANVVEMSDGAQLDASTFGQGDAGTVTVEATDRAVFSESAVFTDVEETGRGNSGNVRVTANIVEMSDNAQLITKTSGQGDAGNVTLTGETVRVSQGAFLSSETSGQGDAGNVTLTGETVRVSQGAFLSSSTLGEGGAGNVTLTGEIVDVRDGAFLLSETSGQGNAGNVSLTGEIVEVRDGAFLGSSTSGQGDAGNITLTGEIVRVSQEAFLFSGNLTNLGEGNTGNVSRTGGTGNAGDITLTGETVRVSQEAFLSSSTEGQENAGNITLMGETVIVSQEAFLSSSTSGEGDAGNITLMGETVEVRDGAFLDSSTLAEGDAGTVTVEATDRVVFSNGQVFTDVERDGRGNAGDVRVTAGIVEVRDNTQLSSRTFGEGDAGTVTVDATDRVVFSNNATVSTNVEENGRGNAGD